MTTTDKQQYIKELATKRDAAIMAHYYVQDEIQAIADHLGDSLYLAQQAQKSDRDVILFCGVNFMAETAKILNPSKTVIVPDNSATCSLAESVNSAECAKWKQSFPNPYLITYINSSIEIKALSDIICTSANVLKVVSVAPAGATLLFAPDINLGSWVNKTLGTHMKLWNGNCVVHQNYDEQALIKLAEQQPKAAIVAHPECPANILRHAQFVGSTTAIMEYVKQSVATDFIVLTENGVARKLRADSPNKRFFFVPLTVEGICASRNALVPGEDATHPVLKLNGALSTHPVLNGIQPAAVCANMKKHTLDKIIAALENMAPQVTLNETLRIAAATPLEKMLAV